MKETQSSVSQWAVATFGETGSNASCTARALKECAELVMQVTTDASGSCMEECADVAICLMWLAERVGLPLREQAAMVTVKKLTSRAALVVQTLTELAYTLTNLVQVGDASCAAWPYIVATYACLARLSGPTLAYSEPVYDQSLSEAIDAKMAINRARKWRLTGDGHGQHVDALDEFIEEGVARDPSFRAKVDAAVRRRQDARDLAQDFQERYTDDEWEDLRHDLARLQREIDAYLVGPG